jgi:hypothetical protein
MMLPLVRQALLLVLSRSMLSVQLLLTVFNVDMRQLMAVVIYFGGGVGAVDASCVSQSTAGALVLSQNFTETCTAVVHPQISRIELVETHGREDSHARDVLLKQARYFHDWKFMQTRENRYGRYKHKAPGPPIADQTQIIRVMAAADAARKAWEQNRRDVDMDMEIEIDEESEAGNPAYAGQIMCASVGRVIAPPISTLIYPRP